MKSHKIQGLIEILDTKIYFKRLQYKPYDNLVKAIKLLKQKQEFER